MTTALLALMLMQPPTHSHRIEWLRPACAGSVGVAELLRLLAEAKEIIERQEEIIERQKKIISLDSQIFEMLAAEIIELKKKGPKQ